MTRTPSGRARTSSGRGRLYLSLARSLAPRPLKPSCGDAAVRERPARRSIKHCASMRTWSRPIGGRAAAGKRESTRCCAHTWTIRANRSWLALAGIFPSPTEEGSEVRVSSAKFLALARRPLIRPRFARPPSITAVPQTRRAVGRYWFSRRNHFSTASFNTVRGRTVDAVCTLCPWSAGPLLSSGARKEGRGGAVQCGQPIPAKA